MGKQSPLAVPHPVLDCKVPDGAVVVRARLPGDGDVAGVHLQTAHCWLPRLFWSVWST